MGMSAGKYLDGELEQAFPPSVLFARASYHATEMNTGQAGEYMTNSTMPSRVRTVYWCLSLCLGRLQQITGEDPVLGRNIQPNIFSTYCPQKVP